MAKWHESITKIGVGTSLEVILPPRDMGEMPMRAISASNAAAGKALADFKIEVGPTDQGPWFAEDLTGTGLPTLAAGATGVYRMTKADRFLRVRAQAAAGEPSCNLTVYLDAIG